VVSGVLACVFPIFFFFFFVRVYIVTCRHWWYKTGCIGLQVGTNLWCELGGCGETVDGERVAQVVCQILDGALASDNGLDKES